MHAEKFSAIPWEYEEFLPLALCKKNNDDEFRWAQFQFTYQCYAILCRGKKWLTRQYQTKGWETEMLCKFSTNQSQIEENTQ